MTDTSPASPGSPSRADVESLSPSEADSVRGRHKRLGARTALISALTLVSRVLGYIREVIAAALFGDQSGIYDAFITAWRVPNLFRRFLGEGALSTSFQTALTAVDNDYGDAAGASLFARTLKVLIGLLIALTLVVMGVVLAAPDEMPFTGWNWLGADPGAVRELTVRVMPFVVLVCVAALFTGALHVRGRFGAPAIAPAAMNVVWIAVLGGLALHFGLHGPSPAAPGEAGEEGAARHMEMARWLGWGVLAAGIVQLAVHLPSLRAAGLIAPRTHRSHDALPPGAPRPLDVLKRAAPLALGAAVYQVNVMVDGLMAESLLDDGGPTLHYFANRVQQFPIALIAIAATSAVFPALQALGHRRDLAELRVLHDRTHMAIAAIALPAAVGLWFLAEPVVEVSFERGAFGREGVERTTLALKALCFAILPAGATGLIARTYYAMGDFRRPVVVSIAMLVLNVGLNAWFLVGFGMDVEGLAAATATTSALNAVLLLPGLTRKLGLPATREHVVLPLVKMLLASVLSGALASGCEILLDDVIGRSLALFAAIGTGGVSYLVFGSLLRIEWVTSLAARFSRKLKRT